MRKITLFLLLLSPYLVAQQVKVQSISKVECSDPTGLYYPVFSSDGSFLLATSANYGGVKKVDYQQKKVQNITYAPGAGYGMQVSEDGVVVMYRKTTMVNNLKQTSLHTQSLASGKSTQLVAPTRENLVPRFASNKAQYLKGRTLVKSNVSNALLVPVIAIESQKMVLYSGNKRTVLSPNGADASYIWPSISPDKTKILYTVAGKGTFVCNMTGSSKVFLGKLNAPVWFNNRVVVGMDDIDDGEKLISSTLVSISVDGTNRQTLATPKGKMAMYPAASAAANKMAFCTETGELYVMNVEIK